MDPLRLLREGELEVRGRLVVSSNAALVCTVSLPWAGAATGRGLPPPGRMLAQLLPDAEPAGNRHVAAAVYKPIRFERPLWDFPDGTLGHREVAAFAVSEATGWSIVPPTILRDGPAGPGMVQLWIDGDEDVEAWDLVQAGDPRLRPMAVFDAVVNNTDRKGGHIVPVVAAPPADEGLHLYGVDHGVCFSDEPKLRTVLWAWRGQPLDGAELEVLRRLRAGLDRELGRELAELLAPAEVTATRARLDALLADGVFPQPDPDRPAIPWPPY